MTGATRTRSDPDARSSDQGPHVYLGLRRGWWVVLSFLLLCAVDAVPMVGPYLALAVLMWMVLGLARAEPRPPRPARAARAARSARVARTAKRPVERRRGETALPTS